MITSKTSSSRRGRPTLGGGRRRFGPCSSRGTPRSRCQRRAPSARSSNVEDSPSGPSAGAAAARLSRTRARVIEPNTTWCADFKGQFKTADGRQCYPLTILDAHTRFLIRCEALLEPTGAAVKDVFDSAFQQYGLPSAIRTDNGPPFASVGAGSLTPLSVWWLRLGIQPERIAPGKPQQNGRQERFHRTLKAETASPPKAHARAQQRAFDLFRREYNFERPHEALGQRPPGRFYTRSTRRYPRRLISPEQEPWFRYARADRNGAFVWDGKRVFLSAALAYETIELRPAEHEDTYDIYFHEVHLGRLLRDRKAWRIAQ